jgi:hypothetical protein
MARKKMSAANKKKVGSVMRAARKRKPSGKRVSFTKAEKSTLREVMHSHHGKKSAAKRKSTARKGRPGRKAGYKHSAATRAKMSKSHRARHRKAARR